MESITVDDLKNLIGELRAMARSLLMKEVMAHSLTPTALAMSALRRAKSGDLDWAGVCWENRRHFFGVLHLTMGHALIDHARRARAKRRSQLSYVPWDDRVLQNLSDEAEDRPSLLIVLDEALAILKDHDPRLAEVIAQYHFAGYSIPEMALFSEVSEKTVDRELKRARALLKKTIEKLQLER